MSDWVIGKVIPPVEPVPLSPVDERGLLVRLRLTALEAGHILLAVPALALLIAILVSWPLSPILVGLLIVGVAVPLAQSFADLHRAAAGRVLGEQIVADYRPTDGAGFVGRPWIWLRDSARWRDVAFLAFAATGGFVLSAVVVFLVAAPVTYAVLAITTGDLWWWLLALPGPVVWWLVTPALVRGRAMAERGILGSSRTAALEHRVAAVSASRAEAIDHSAAELRRIERDLHDGAQARIVSLGMHLGMAEELMREDPAAAEAMLREARDTTMSALDDLRTIVHGIHPPVLADRGLAGAVEAMALQLAVPVTITVNLPGRVPAPVESAIYFAVVECLANTVKHAEAHRAWVSMRHEEGVLTVDVGDDGVGGADLDAGTGLRGVARRLEAFDGTLAVDSPAAGPTIVTLGVPCDLSSPRT